MKLFTMLFSSVALSALCVLIFAPRPSAAPVEVGGQAPKCWRTFSAPCVECEGFNSYYCQARSTGYKECTPDSYDCNPPPGVCSTYWLLLTECP